MRVNIGKETMKGDMKTQGEGRGKTQRKKTVNHVMNIEGKDSVGRKKRERERGIDRESEPEPELSGLSQGSKNSFYSVSFPSVLEHIAR